MTDPEQEFRKQKALSKEAWAAIGAIAVALIGGIVTITTTLVNRSTPPPSRSIDSPSASLESGTVSTTPISARRLEQSLDSVNIGFSNPALAEQLGNSFSEYPQFAEGCLRLLDNQRLRKEVYFDVIFWNYTEELGGTINSDSPDGNLDESILKIAMVRAYNTNNGSTALSFEEIVESAQ